MAKAVNVIDEACLGRPASFRACARMLGPTPGHYGVIGMRERAFTLAGTLELQKPDDGGLRVFARIPLT